MRQVALQRSAQLRGQFMAKAMLYPKASDVWLDESAYDSDWRKIRHLLAFLVLLAPGDDS